VVGLYDELWADRGSGLLLTSNASLVDAGGNSCLRKDYGVGPFERAGEIGCPAGEPFSVIAWSPCRESLSNFPENRARLSPTSSRTVLFGDT